MVKKPISTLAIVLLSATDASASSMTITGPSEVNIGDSFQVQIWGDLQANGLRAGGITFSANPSVVQLDNVTLDLNVDSSLSCPGSANCPAPAANSAPVVWGQFLSDLIGSGTGQTLMATLDVTALAPGTATFGMADVPALTGGWFGTGFDAIAVPTFVDLSVCIPTLSGDNDNDGVHDCSDPDDDNDGIADTLDRAPLDDSNANCTFNDGSNATLVGELISSKQTTCAAGETVDVSGNTSVDADGDLRLIAPAVSFTDTVVTGNGRVEVINANPCPGCTPP